METLARYIHQTPHRFVFIGAGSGTLALHSLSSVVGPNLLEATFPFSERAFESTLNENTKDAKDKTLQLAGKAFLRAIRICNDQEPLFGISFASKLKGLKECEAFLASWGFKGNKLFHIQYQKKIEEKQEEKLFRTFLLNLIADNCCLKGYQDELTFTESIKVHVIEHNFMQSTIDLLSQKIMFFQVSDSGNIFKGLTKTSTLQKKLVIPGSFNPLHEGHIAMMKAARNLAKEKGLSYDQEVFEISVFNVDKPPIDTLTILRRISQFAGSYNVVLTTTPMFLEKARIFPNSIFVIGSDTLTRLLNKQYYQDSEENKMKTLLEIRQLGCKFIVAGRSSNGMFQSPSEIIGKQKDNIKELFYGLEGFRVDISSTQLRSDGKKIPQNKIISPELELSS